MATGRLTKRSVEAIPIPTSERARAFLWDETLKGFGVMVTSKGARSYVVQYRIGGRGSPTRRATLGQHGSPWTVEKARDRAAALLELVRCKIDPIEADKERLARERQGRADNERSGFSTVADAFVVHVKARKLRSAEDIAAVFKRDLKPHFVDTPLPHIIRPEIHNCLAGIGARSQSAANKAYSWLRTMFTWAVDQGRFGITVSPMANMSPPFPQVRRKRVLRGDELRQVWESSAELGAPFGPLVKMLMLSGQRLREVAGMRWEEVDLQQGTWSIPGDRTKNKLEHLCPLSLGAVSVLADSQPDEKLRKGLVFTTNGRTAVSGFSRAKRRLDSLIHISASERAALEGGELSELAPWTFHDLRRSLATGLQALGFPVEHNEAVINHVSGKRGGLVGVYQLHDYWGEKVSALAAWDLHLAALQSKKSPAKDGPDLAPNLRQVSDAS